MPIVMPDGTSVAITANARIRFRMLPSRGLNKRRVRTLTLDGSIVVDMQLVNVIERCWSSAEAGGPLSSTRVGRRRQADERRRTEQPPGATIGTHSAQEGYRELRQSR